MDHEKHSSKDLNSQTISEKLLSMADRADLPKNMQDLRRIGLKAISNGITAVLPATLLDTFIQVHPESLWLGEEHISRADFDSILIIGGGKATRNMCQVFVEKLGDIIPFTGLINIPYSADKNFTDKISSDHTNSYVQVNQCSHPIPDSSGVTGVQHMLTLIQESSTRTLIIVLISGGGSALLPLPRSGITLDDLQAVNRLLIASGADIDEINTVRKHLSGIKGGQLSAYAHPRKIRSLILSDVIGDKLDAIASGPTVGDSTTFAEAVHLSQKYGIFTQYPSAVQLLLQEGEKGNLSETPKPGSPELAHTINYLIGSAKNSAVAVQRTLAAYGIPAEIYSITLSGEAREYGKSLGSFLDHHHLPARPWAFIGTGEFTVSLSGTGIGGRNQEMLLSFLCELHILPDSPFHQLPFIMIAAAFDGIEGNSPAMGGLIDSSSLRRAMDLKLDLASYLKNNDSYTCFSKLADALITGPTHTNVNDIFLILIGTTEMVF